MGRRRRRGRGRGVKEDRREKQVPTTEISTSDVVSPTLNPPEELLSEILSWLPVKSLLRFRSVCKPWLSLISSVNFAKTQHNRAANNPNHPSSLIVFGGEKAKICGEKSISLIRRLDSVKNRVIRLKPPIINAIDTLLVDIVGCYDGIVCLKLLGIAFLWNPATKQAKDVLFSCPWHCIYYSSSIGFGFDPVSSDYKVVRIFYGLGSVRSVQVYSANAAGSWREIQVEELSIGESNVLIETADACVKGVLYWKVFGGFEIVSFDLQNEVVGLIPMPSCVKQETPPGHIVDFRACSVVDFRNCVAMILYSRDKAAVSLWTLDEGYGEMGRSWTNKFTFEAVPSMDMIHGYLKTGKILGSDEAGLIMYDPKNKERKYVKTSDRVSNAFEYTDSLVSINGSIQFTEKMLMEKGAGTHNVMVY